MPEYMNAKQAMNYMGIKSPSTFSYYIHSGLPTIQVGRSKRISKTDIDKFMADHRAVMHADK